MKTVVEPEPVAAAEFFGDDLLRRGVGFDGYLGTLAGDADDLLEGDQTVENFGDLLLEEPFEELVGRCLLYTSRCV